MIFTAAGFAASSLLCVCHAVITLTMRAALMLTPPRCYGRYDYFVPPLRYTPLRRRCKMQARCAACAFAAIRRRAAAPVSMPSAAIIAALRFTAAQDTDTLCLTPLHVLCYATLRWQPRCCALSDIDAAILLLSCRWRCCHDVMPLHAATRYADTCYAIADAFIMPLDAAAITYLPSCRRR